MGKLNRGFSLAELLIVVAIIAVLVAIAIPVFASQKEKAREAVDMSTMRSAQTALALAVNDGTIAADGRKYYYDPKSAAGTGLSTVKPVMGYGKAKKPASEWWTGSGEAFGTPNMSGDHPAVLSVAMNADGSMSFSWGGAYAGENVTSAAEYKALSFEERLARDEVLLDSLQEVFRGMTYGEIREMFFNADGTPKAGVKVDKLGNNCCIILATGSINGGAGTVNTGKTGITATSAFQSAGYDTSLDKNRQYIVNSVPDTTNTIWLNLGISENALKSEGNNDIRAQGVYTYVKSGGAATPESLRQVNRGK